MSIRTCLPAAALLAGAAATAAGPAGPVPSQVTAGARILRPAVVGAGSDLENGLAAPDISGEVVANPAAVTPARPARVTVRPAAVRVYGHRGGSFSLALPASGECSLQAAGASLPVDGFLVSVKGGAAGSKPGSFTFDGLGLQDLRITPTFKVGTGQLKGFYRGTLPIYMIPD